MPYCSLSDAYGPGDWTASGTVSHVPAPLQPSKFCTNDPYFDSENNSKGSKQPKGTENAILDKFNDIGRRIEAFTAYAVAHTSPHTSRRKTQPFSQKATSNARLENILHLVLVSIFSVLVVENLVG